MTNNKTIIFLLMIFLSSIHAVKGSRSEIDELKAAIEIRMKNIIENNAPKGKE